MFGAIAGDIIGSVYEYKPCRKAGFPLFQTDCIFTDDTVLTVATAFALMTDGDYAQNYKIFGRLYPAAGYGENFQRWLAADSTESYGSWGNGAAMRVSPIGLAFDSVDEVLAEAERSAVVTHDHPEGIKGAQAVALAVLLGRQGVTKDDIRREISERFAYDLDRSLSDVQRGYAYEVSSQKSVPEAIIAFLAAEDYEQAVRNAVLLGGDADTQACIAGAIAEAFFGGVPAEIASEVRQRLPRDLYQVVDDFYSKYLP
jgi:ADP-ribosylglycohydrolase